MAINYFSFRGEANMEQTRSYFYDFIPIKYDADETTRQSIIENYPPPQLPTGDNTFNLQNESAGNRINTRVLLSDFKVHLTRNNKTFLRITFNNNLDSINAVIWNNNNEVEECLPLLEEFTIFDIEGTVTEFNNRKSITISKLEPYKDKVLPYDYLPYTQQNITEMTIELFSYINELDTPYKELCLKTLDVFWKDFSLSPAAKGFHHNYLGGLLKHTVGLMRFARYILVLEEDHYKATMKLINVVEKAFKTELWEQHQNDNGKSNLIWKDTIDHLYNMLQGMMSFKEDVPNHNIVITSILFHDIGKLLEYDYVGKSFNPFKYLYPSADMDSLDNRQQKGISMDQLGVMIGHIPYGVLILTKLIEQEEFEFSLEIIHQISHCILCHHALPEWGSCIREPASIEGYIVHVSDFLDSRYENTEAIK